MNVATIVGDESLGGWQGNGDRQFQDENFG